MELEDFNLFGGYDPYKLERDDTIVFPITRKLSEFGNRVYNRYPARSIFLVPRATIFHKSKAGKTLNILDPFMGSGTTAVESSIQNCNIYGTEMDAFARLIAEVSIYRFDKNQFVLAIKRAHPVAYARQQYRQHLPIFLSNNFHPGCRD